VLGNTGRKLASPVLVHFVMILTKYFCILITEQLVTENNNKQTKTHNRP